MRAENIEVVLSELAQNELQNKTLNLLAVVEKINTQTWSLTATTLKPLMIVTVVLGKLGY